MSDLSKADALRQIAKLEKQLAKRKNKKRTAVDTTEGNSDRDTVESKKSMVSENRVEDHHTKVLVSEQGDGVSEMGDGVSEERLQCSEQGDGASEQRLQTSEKENVSDNIELSPSDVCYRVLVRNKSSVVLNSCDPDEIPELHLLNVKEPIEDLTVLPLHSAGSAPLHFIVSYFNPTKRRSMLHRFHQRVEEEDVNGFEPVDKKRPVLMHDLVDVLEGVEVFGLVKSLEGGFDAKCSDEESLEYVWNDVNEKFKKKS